MASWFSHIKENPNKKMKKNNKEKKIFLFYYKEEEEYREQEKKIKVFVDEREKIENTKITIKNYIIFLDTPFCPISDVLSTCILLIELPLFAISLV